jgi:putative two-component system response regulator
MAIADVYDALISRRVYKTAMSHENAVAIIIDGRGSHFEPAIVDAFLSIQEKFVEIAEHFSDLESA